MTKRVMNCRPNPISAAMYTLKDLGADVIIVHGPAGCCYKSSLTLSMGNTKVVTTALTETDIVFGGSNALTEVIQKVIAQFNPKCIGIVGTCASMIIGDDLQEVANKVQTDIPIVPVEVHGGFGDVTTGMAAALDAGLEAGLIDAEEVKRQKELLGDIVDIERSIGLASHEYIDFEQGDNINDTADVVFGLLKQGKRGLSILNGRKDSAFIFADINLAVNEVAKKFGTKIVTMANLDENLGLPITRNAARVIKSGLTRASPVDHITGGLDEYVRAGRSIGEIVKVRYSDFDFAIITDMPHAVPVSFFNGIEVFSFAFGPRRIKGLKENGHTYVTREKDIFSKVTGADSIVESEFGAMIRSMAERR